MALITAIMASAEPANPTPITVIQPDGTSFLLNNDTTHLQYGDQDNNGTITASDITAVYNVLLGNN